MKYRRENMQNHLRKRFERFSKGTSMHGFSELYQTKSFFWSAFWALIIFGSLSTTSFQMYKALQQYVDQPTSTVILAAKEDELLYPPLRICYMHWLFWVDWNKATASLNMSKEGVLYGLSYIHHIYTTTKFNVDHAEKCFKRIMKEHNLSTLSQFYKLIARHVPIIGDNNLIAYFDQTEIIFKKPNYYMYCYTVSESKIFEYFHQNRDSFQTKAGGKVISFSTFDETYNHVKHFVNEEEYTRFMIRWVQRKSMYVIDKNYTLDDFTTFAPPVLLYPNGYNAKSIDIFAENDVYSISLQLSARKLKSSEKTRCSEGQQAIASNDTCKYNCKAISWKAACSCQSIDLSSFIKDDMPQNLCQREIIFMSTKGGNDFTYYSNTSNYYSKQTCNHIINSSPKRKDCENRCIAPCTIWSYEASLSIATMASLIRKIGNKNVTNITIDYPLANNVIVMTEINSQTWENFVGSVGGLLGIWTGASVMSVLQFFYLCCFADCGCRNNCFSSLFRRKKEQQKEQYLDSSKV